MFWLLLGFQQNSRNYLYSIYWLLIAFISINKFLYLDKLKGILYIWLIVKTLCNTKIQFHFMLLLFLGVGTLYKIGVHERNSNILSLICFVIAYYFHFLLFHHCTLKILPNYSNVSLKYKTIFIAIIGEIYHIIIS